jgi:chemotaxis family two-component system response regulator Rcp1
VNEVNAPRLILLVDDNFGDTKLVEMALVQSRSDTRLEIVMDGEKAISYLFRQGVYAKAPRPDLVILDWNLPRKNGLEVLRDMRRDSALSRIPVVIFTGGKFVPEMGDACRGKLVFCVSKPAELDNFFAVINSIDKFVKTTAESFYPEDEKLEMLRRLVAA